MAESPVCMDTTPVKAAPKEPEALTAEPPTKKRQLREKTADEVAAAEAKRQAKQQEKQAEKQRAKEAKAQEKAARPAPARPARPGLEPRFK